MKRIEKKAVKDGGEIVITERKTQGAARLSALHDSYNSIISQPDSGVKSYQNANDPRGVYYKDIIYLFQKANASTFMHETAHWFKKELKKFGSEKNAMMLKKVDEWKRASFQDDTLLTLKVDIMLLKQQKNPARSLRGFF